MVEKPEKENWRGVAYPGDHWRSIPYLLINHLCKDTVCLVLRWWQQYGQRQEARGGLDFSQQ